MEVLHYLSHKRAPKKENLGVVHEKVDLSLVLPLVSSVNSSISTTPLLYLFLCYHSPPFYHHLH